MFIGDSAGDAHTQFNFTIAMRWLCADIVARLPELAHINLSSVAISFSQARKSFAHGLQASLTPLRFEGGAAISRDGRFTCQRVCDPTGREYLYILTFYLPRFLNHSVEEKLATVFHELWHISPKCDGDLRRYSGRCFAHGSSQEKYDAHVERLAQKWLALDPPYHLYAFLDCSFSELVAEHGRVYGTRIAAPKLIKRR
jgi:hypothetical protein